MSHVYHGMQRCSKESSFVRFYIRYFTFTKPAYLYDNSLDNVELAELIQKIREEIGYGNGYGSNGFRSQDKKNFGGNWNKNRGKRGYYNFKNSDN